MKSLLSAVRNLNERENEVPKQKPEPEKASNVSMSTSKVCEDTSLKLEKLELTVRKQPDKQKKDYEQEFPTLLVAKNNGPKVDEQYVFVCIETTKLNFQGKQQRKRCF